MGSNRYLLTEMSWPEVEEALKTVEVGIIPVGAHEQHGPNLAESCDAVRATEFCKLLAERLYPRILVTPTVNIGVSYHHMPFPGTITLRPETLVAVVRDIACSLREHGIKKMLIINAHGGNQQALGVAVTNISQEMKDVEIAWTQYTNFSTESIAKHVKSEMFGHSCEREVSEAMYLAPHIIKKDKIEKGKIIGMPYIYSAANGRPLGVSYTFDQVTENGALGDATKASYEAGKDICEEALEKIGAFLEDFMSK
ncbi:MAG: creatininase family protein [Clostridia bacterium]|nr:creatininase family protein [Clostridia bacterium]